MKRTEYYEEIHNHCIEATKLIADDGKTLIQWYQTLDKVQALLNKIESHVTDLTDGVEDASDGHIILPRK